MSTRLDIDSLVVTFQLFVYIGLWHVISCLISDDIMCARHDKCESDLRQCFLPRYESIIDELAKILAGN